MIIYSNKKEFIGIDEESLKSLGFSNLADLQSVAADFGDLFVKTPGHVHNFKHVHWIDFVLCEEDKNTCKAIINAKGGNYNCTLEIKTIYLTSSPNSKSYIINLNNLRALSSNETNNISSELQTRSAQIASIAVITKTEEIEQTQEVEKLIEPKEIKTSEIVEPTSAKTIIADPYEIEDDLSLDAYELSQEQLDEVGEPDSIDSNSSDSAIEIDTIEIDDKVELVKEEAEESLLDDEDSKGEYSFDINKTAQLLEMDIATIEDFVNDFIAQAQEFKDKLYNSVEEEDLIVLKALSHQLKGVAANLRIYDCQDILIKINKDDDFKESKSDLNTFYKFISKLSDEEIIDEDEDEDYILEIDDSLSTKSNNETKVDSLEIEKNDDIMEINESKDKDDDYILEVDDTLSTKSDNETKTDSLEVEKNDDIMEINESKDKDDDYILEVDDTDLLDLEKGNTDEVKEASPIKIYNKIEIANEIGLNEEFFNDFFQDYIVQSQELVSMIKKSIDEDSSDEWNSLAIKLKGMSDNMRIDTLSSELETLVTTKNKTDAQDALMQIETLLPQIITKKD